jgi:hypothetical protein
MKFLRIFFVLAAFCGMSLSAFGDDFKMNVLDPTGSFPVDTITTTSFTASFISCAAFPLPSGITADGCFAGANASPVDWTSLGLSITGNASTAGQTADCSLAPSSNFFAESSCSTTVDGNFLLTYYDGTIPTNDGTASIFFITETGVSPPGDFPTVNAVANVPIPTPEPGSILLMLTGTILLGFVCIPGFRRATLN